MNRKISFGAVIALMAITAAITVSITYTVAMKIFDRRVFSVTERQTMYNKVSEIDQKIRQYYMGSIDEQKLRNSLATGYLEGLNDANSRYLSPDEYTAEKETEKGEIYGLGFDVERNQEGNILIYGVTPNSPAAAAGFKKGDVIVQVAGKRVTAVGYDKSLAELTSAATSSISITTRRAGVETTREVPKAKYASVTVEERLLANKVGYIRLKSFNATTPDQFESALNNLIKQGATAYIFDVRDNSGGQIASVCQVLDRLLPAGTILRSQNKSGAIKVEYTSNASQLSYPVAVLINGKTANAAELFAAAIRDFKKGELVGTHTLGKGTMQKTFQLNDGSAISLTVAKILPPTGESFDGVGITPDFDVKPSLPDVNFAMLTDAEDNQLATAIDVVAVNSSSDDDNAGDSDEAASS
jgi:carboxyl-terminal processing protease